MQNLKMVLRDVYFTEAGFLAYYTWGYWLHSFLTKVAVYC
jgi:hypothetical protein